ncbi:MAG TPA: hypothetical protein VI756_05275 [Blastocatellia bacterium]
MSNYPPVLRSLFRLYVDYLKIAMIGIGASALVFAVYAAFATDHLLIGTVFIGVPLVCAVAAFRRFQRGYHARLTRKRENLAIIRPRAPIQSDQREARL